MSQFPDDANGAALQQMAERGVDLVSPRTIEFEHCFPDEARAREFFAAVEGTVGEARLFDPDPDQGRGWEVQCRQTMVPSYAAISEAERRLAAIAESFDGYADGWGTLSNPDGSPAD